MVFLVGLVEFSLPSLSTPVITLGTSRSSVLLLLPLMVRYCSVALKTSPPTFRSQRKFNFQFLYLKLFSHPAVKSGFLSPRTLYKPSEIGRPVEGSIKISPLLLRR